jgi:hypothetical protein
MLIAALSFIYMLPFFVTAIDANPPRPQTNIKKIYDETYFNAPDHRHSRGFVSEYLRIVTGSLINERFNLKGCLDSESFIPADEQFGIYKWEANDIETIRRSMLLQGVLTSLAKLYKKTPVSEKIKKIEKTVAKYFVTELSQFVNEENPTLVLPGEMDEDYYSQDEKIYSISLISFFSPDEKKTRVDFSVSLKMEYYANLAFGEYSFLRDDFTFTYTNSSLNTMLRAELYFLAVMENDNELIPIMRIQFRY